MHLSFIAATELLSFTELELDVPEHLSVIVGPNGSGKTNLGRVVRFAAAALRAAATGDFTALDREWSVAGRFGSPRFDARVGLAFGADRELSMIEDWARAALLNAFQLPNANPGSA